MRMSVSFSEQPGGAFRILVPGLIVSEDSWFPQDFTNSCLLVVDIMNLPIDVVMRGKWSL